MNKNIFRSAPPLDDKEKMRQFIKETTGIGMDRDTNIVMLRYSTGMTEGLYRRGILGHKVEWDKDKLLEYIEKIEDPMHQELARELFLSLDIEAMKEQAIQMFRGTKKTTAKTILASDQRKRENKTISQTAKITELEVVVDMLEEACAEVIHNESTGHYSYEEASSINVVLGKLHDKLRARLESIEGS